jgi:hypothetical protein
MRIGTLRSLAAAATALMCSGLRIQAKTVDPCFERREGHLVLVMDVGNDRNRRTRHDLCQALGRLDFVAGAPDDVASRRGERIDLLQGSFDVGRLRRRHRLHGDWCVTTNGDASDMNLSRTTSLEHDPSIARLRGDW